MSNSVGSKVSYIGYAFIFVILVGSVELSSMMLPKLLGSRLVVGRIFYMPPRVSQEEYDHYLRVRDPRLGWPSPNRNENPSFHIDPSGARWSPAFPQPGRECVSLYGDSYTYGEQVSDEEAWGNILARRLGCRVGNFGIGGYGTDQAFLRFLDNTGDPAPFVVLGIFADNLLRNVNQYRQFLTGGEPFSLKPRFILENGSLKLIPIPTLSFDEFEAALKNPKAVWQHEVFLPTSSEGPIIWSFPYTLSFIRFLASRHFARLVETMVLEKPSWISFYNKDHESHALQTTVAIVSEFQHVAAQRGKTLLVVIFPNASRFDYYRKKEGSPFAPLVAALTGQGIAVRDLSVDFASYLDGRSFCTLNYDRRECTGHFNSEGNELIAKIIYEYTIASSLAGR